MTTDLRTRSIRTLAWLGDAEFECDVRRRIARRGDYPTRRLDLVRAAITRAETQAAMLATLSEALTDDEAAVVRRARNVRNTGHVRRDTAAYRAATALEALVAHWCLAEPSARARYDALLGPLIEQAIDDAIDRPLPRRG